jgi:hypothetical protein
MRLGPTRGIFLNHGNLTERLADPLMNHLDTITCFQIILNSTRVWNLELILKIYHILICRHIVWYIVIVHEQEVRKFLRNVDIGLHDGIVTFTGDVVRKSDLKRNNVDVNMPLYLTKQHFLKMDAGVAKKLHNS